MTRYWLVTFLLCIATSVAAQQFTLLDTPPNVIGTCTTPGGEKVPCVKFRRLREPTLTPAPTSVPSPRPMPCTRTVGTLDFEGKKDLTWGATFTLDPEGQMFCFDVLPGQTPKPPAFGKVDVQVGSKNDANAPCAEMQSTLVAPTGKTHHSNGAQVMGVINPRTPGRWYFWVRALWIDTQPKCGSYTFTAR